MPTGQEGAWWEMWVLPEYFPSLIDAIKRLRLTPLNHQAKFPDRIIFSLYATITQMEILCLGVGGIAELRQPTSVPSYFFLEELSFKESQEWAKELQSRCITNPTTKPTYVCLLDTGVNYGHTLIKPFLSATDLHAWGSGPLWPPSDNLSFSHGTEMTGLILYGDLTNALASPTSIEINYRIESVRILPSAGQNDEKDYGPITAGAVAITETVTPPQHCSRVFCMAVTGENGTRNGEPTPWSATIDNLCFPNSVENNPGRLFVISAGNVRTMDPNVNYLDQCRLSPVEDPAQAWNALTIGAMTEKWSITDPSFADWNPLATPGSLSPESRTSTIWDKIWPTKPDIVFEGGNWAENPSQTEWQKPEDLQLLTTHSKVKNHAFTTLIGTSPATALAARLAAQLQSTFPNYWPETIRALMVHSAEWSPQMLKLLKAAKSKTEKRALISMFGFGVPDLDRALWSAINRFNLIIQDHIIPFHQQGVMNEMRFYALPWPADILASMREKRVRLRITLSYFIEGNPSRRGYKGHFSYASHGLRFQLKRPLETQTEFMQRISLEQRDKTYDKKKKPKTKDCWECGSNSQNQGSLHADIWNGSGAELAECDCLAIHPVTGWWKQRKAYWRKSVRYALIVSLQTDEEKIDLYTAVEQLIKLKTETQVVIKT